MSLLAEPLHDKRDMAHRQSMDRVFDAFFVMLRDHQFDEITASALISKSGVARSTFYRHFSSVEDVVAGYFGQVYETLDLLTRGTVDFYSRDYFINVFTVYRLVGMRMLYCRRAGRSDSLIQSILDYHVANVGDMAYNSADRYELFYYAGAIYSVATEWIASGLKETPEELADIFMNCQQGYKAAA